jgi:hypothetical protein
MPHLQFRWHKWGVEDDESLALLEQYCATDDAKFSGMKRLAMHTADQAKGYPKLIKLRPYHTLPDYVEACSRYCMTHGQQHPIQVRADVRGGVRHFLQLVQYSPGHTRGGGGGCYPQTVRVAILKVHGHMGCRFAVCANRWELCLVKWQPYWGCHLSSAQYCAGQVLLAR